MAARKSQLIIIFLTVFIDLLGLTIIIPIMPFYVQQFVEDHTHLGAIYGILIASYSLMQFIFAPIWGRLSDRVGRRPVILFSLAGTAITNLMFALSHTFTMLFVARILTGVCAATISTAMAYIADVTTREDRAKGMGLIGAAFGMGFVLGPAIGGILGKYNLALPLFASAGFSIIAFIFAFFKLPETVDTSKISPDSARQFSLQRLLNAVQHPNLGPLFIIFFLVQLSFNNMTTIFVYFTADRFGYHTDQNGYLFGMIGVVGAVIQGGLIGRLAKKFGEKRLLTFSTGMLGVSLIIMPLSVSIAMFIPILIAIAGGIGLHNPSINSLISKNCTEDEQGGMLGLSQSFAALGRVVAPLWAGLFYDKLGITMTLWSAGALALLASSLSLKLYDIDLTQSNSQSHL